MYTGNFLIDLKEFELKNIIKIHIKAFSFYLWS
jgi:hypothetical protein